MRGNRRRDTQPELRLRSALHRLGRRFRVDYPVVTPTGRVRVDIAFPRMRVAVFVDGCFWHGCPLHGTKPKENSAYWTEKLSRNRHRDQANSEGLRAAGWSVVRIWEHEDVDEAVSAVVQVLDDTEP